LKEVSRKRLGRQALERARGVRLMVFDVDGVLTDGTLLFGPAGEDHKVFYALDGHGLKMLAQAGIACALLSGRRSAAVARRAEELGIEHVLQGVEHKLPAYRELLKARRLKMQDAGYMGDELVDLPVLTRCGFACAPREAPAAVRSRAHYVPAAAAGRGAVREVCEVVLRAQDKLDAMVERYLA
jgi:3-deoxy-D-manno-octulosonate 8-phosphate phosphatase (KDO 8-P phosphatase)